MKKLLLTAMFSLMLCASVFAQDNTVIRKIRIMHADPGLIVLILSVKSNIGTPP